MEESIEIIIGKVVKIIDAYRIVINKGAADGLKKGNRFLVYAIGEELFDPDTNESLGMIEIVKGKGEIVHLQDRLATLETYEVDNEKKIKTVPYAGVFGGSTTETIEIKKIFEEPAKGDMARKL